MAETKTPNGVKADTVSGAGGPAADPNLLSPSVQAIDAAAMYMAERGMVASPVEVAFAAVLAIEAAGLTITTGAPPR